MPPRTRRMRSGMGCTGREEVKGKASVKEGENMRNEHISYAG